MPAVRAGAILCLSQEAGGDVVQIDVLTLFPQMFAGPMGLSMMWKAQELGLLHLHLHDMRDWGAGRRRQVDDTPCGGGGGMILRADVLVRAVEDIVDAAPLPVILLSPQGRVFTQTVARELASLERMLLVCGHYEGVDERVRQLVITDEISIGDYVLTGGELAAMVVIDATVRQLPGVLGAADAVTRDSHADGLLEGPHYTWPVDFRGLRVPDLLLGGDHGRIAAWRRRQSLLRTRQRRPELLAAATLDKAEREWLARQEADDQPGGE